LEHFAVGALADDLLEPEATGRVRQRLEVDVFAESQVRHGGCVWRGRSAQRPQLPGDAADLATRQRITHETGTKSNEQKSTRENSKGGCWMNTNPMGWNGMRCVAEGRCGDGQLGRRTEELRVRSGLRTLPLTRFDGGNFRSDCLGHMAALNGLAGCASVSVDRWESAEQRLPCCASHHRPADPIFLVSLDSLEFLAEGCATRRVTPTETIWWPNRRLF
jgi:hypothetical protein